MISIINITIPLQCILKLFIFLFIKISDDGIFVIILSAVLQREKVAAELHVAQREISHGAIVLQLKICFTYITTEGQG